MKSIMVLLSLFALLVGAAVAEPQVSMQDTIAVAEGGDVTQSASNDASVAGDDAILYQSSSQSAAGTGDVAQGAGNTGTATGDNAYVNQGAVQSAEGDTVLQAASNDGLTVGNSAIVGQSITQGATSTTSAEQYGNNLALIYGGNAWVGQLVQSGAIGGNTYQVAYSGAGVVDLSGIGSNAIGQTIILGSTASGIAGQEGINEAYLNGGDGNVAQLAQAGATSMIIGQVLANFATVMNANTFVVGQDNVAGAETDMSAGTEIDQHQYNTANWENGADGLLAQHIEAAAFAETLIQDQDNIVNLV